MNGNSIDPKKLTSVVVLWLAALPLIAYMWKIVSDDGSERDYSALICIIILSAMVVTIAIVGMYVRRAEVLTDIRKEIECHTEGIDHEKTKSGNNGKA